MIDGDKLAQAIIIGVFVSLTAFLGSAVLRTFKNEERVYGAEMNLIRIESRQVRMEDKLDKIYYYILEKEEKESE